MIDDFIDFIWGGAIKKEAKNLVAFLLACLFFKKNLFSFNYKKKIL